MRKTNVLLRLLIALALVAVMAVLPLLSAAWQDRGTLGTPGLGQMQAVKLNFQDKIPGLGLLHLMYRGQQWQPINASAAVMTQEEAEQSALEGLEPYRKAGLIAQELAMEPYMVEAQVLSIDTDQAAIVWHVVLVDWDNGISQGEVDLTLEDATGRIMCISYAQNTKIPQGKREKMLEDVASLFFPALGIGDYDQLAVDDLEMEYLGDGGTVAQRYRFGDAAYGEIVVNVFVYSYGFYITFFG